MISVITQKGKTRIVADNDEDVNERLAYARSSVAIRPLQIGVLYPADRSYVLKDNGADLRVVLHYNIGGDSPMLKLDDQRVRNHLQGQETLWLV